MVTQVSGGRRRAGWRRAVLCGSAGIALVALSSSRWSSVAGADPTTTSAPMTTIVAAAADIPAGAVVDSSMLTITVVPANVAAGLVNDAATLVGRVVVVPVAKGEPIGVGMTAPRAAAQPGHRLVRVSMGHVDVAPDVRVGVDADLVASFGPSASEPRASVAVVATARVAALDATPQEATPDAAPLGSSALIGSTTAVTLDCAAADALRVLWARDNARTLRLLVHSGDTPPPASG